MSWFISLVITGAMFTAGNNLPTYSFENTLANSTGGSIKPILLDATERFEESYPFSKNGKISVSNVSGSITVKAWDKNEIKLVYVKTAETKEELSDAEVKIEAQQDEFSAKVRYHRSKFKKRNRGNGKWKRSTSLSIDIELTVPRTAKLDSIENVSGSVVVSDMANYCDISVVSGTVKATNLRGTAKLQTVSGSVTADFDRLDNGSNISLESVSGSVKLTIPSDSHATVKADTLTGSIKNDFGLRVRKGKYVGRDMHGKIGNGKVKIKLNSVSGSLSVNRKNDGKSLNPATDLLKGKSSDDDIIDIDISRIETEIESIEIAEANLEELKEIVEAARLITKEMPKHIKIDRITDRTVKELARALKLIEVEVALDKKKKHEPKHKKKIKEIEKENEKVLLKQKEKLKKKIKEAEKKRTKALEQTSEARFFGGSPFIQEFSDSLLVKDTPSIEINAKNCDVIVKGWSKPQIKYSLSRVKRGRSTKPIELRSGNQEKVFIEVIAGVNSRDRGRLEVFVPKKSHLEIHTRREIRLEGVSGEFKLFGADGTINVRDSKGWLGISSRGGLIRVIGFTGNVSTETVSGAVMLEGNFEKINAKAYRSDVTVTLPRDANAKIFSNGVTRIGRFHQIQRNPKSGYWQLGNGSAQYKFNLGTGRVNIRTKDSINVE